MSSEALPAGVPHFPGPIQIGDVTISPYQWEDTAALLISGSPYFLFGDPVDGPFGYVADDGIYSEDDIAGSFAGVRSNGLYDAKAAGCDPIQVAAGADGFEQSRGDYGFAAGGGPVVHSPDGTRWRLTVDNDGDIHAESIPA